MVFLRWGRDGTGQPDSRLTAVASREAKRKAVQRENRIASEAGAWDCGLMTGILLVLIQINLISGGRDAGRAARPAGVPAQTDMPPPRRHGNDRVNLEPYFTYYLVT